MTHPQYLEQHEALSRSGLAVIATLLGRDDIADAKTATTNLRARLDALWEERRTAAEREVNP